MEKSGTVTLLLVSGYQFTVDFGQRASLALITDATPPLGSGGGPDSEMLLMAAVGNCLSASLEFSFRKFKNAEVPMRTTVDAHVALNGQGRLRMQSIKVVIRLGVAISTLRLAERALAQYEDFCVVTQSVRAAIPVNVTVLDSSGRDCSPRKNVNPS